MIWDCLLDKPTNFEPAHENSNVVSSFLNKLQVQMMIFPLLIKIDSSEEVVLLEMEDLHQLVLLRCLGSMVTWKPRFTTLSKKHTVQFFEPLKLNLMLSLG